MALQNKSDMTYSESRYSSKDKPLVWLHGKVKTPPFSAEARLEAGLLIRRLQKNERLSMPHSRPMPSIGRRCHELRIIDGDLSWRIVYRIDQDAILILEVFNKKTQQIPKQVIATCKDRIRDYEDATK
jgi:phage-related protein